MKNPPTLGTEHPALSYVILAHDHPVSHWDVMLEDGESLRTWRLTAPPGPGISVAAEPSFPHRRHYLDYEGPVSGGRGQVVRWDAGSYSWEDQSDAHISVRVDGKRLRGKLILARGPDNRWQVDYFPL